MKQREAKIPPAGKTRPHEALERIVKLYTDWGKPELAVAWQRKQVEVESPASR